MTATLTSPQSALRNVLWAAEKRADRSAKRTPSEHLTSCLSGCRQACALPMCWLPPYLGTWVGRNLGSCHHGRFPREARNHFASSGPAVQGVCTLETQRCNALHFESEFVALTGSPALDTCGGFYNTRSRSARRHVCGFKEERVQVQVRSSVGKPGCSP